MRGRVKAILSERKEKKIYITIDEKEKERRKRWEKRHLWPSRRYRIDPIHLMFNCRSIEKVRCSSVSLRLLLYFPLCLTWRLNSLSDVNICATAATVSSATLIQSIMVNICRDGTRLVQRPVSLISLHPVNGLSYVREVCHVFTRQQEAKRQRWRKKRLDFRWSCTGESAIDQSVKESKNNVNNMFRVEMCDQNESGAWEDEKTRMNRKMEQERRFLGSDSCVSS